MVQWFLEFLRKRSDLETAGPFEVASYVLALSACWRHMVNWYLLVVFNEYFVTGSIPFFVLYEAHQPLRIIVKLCLAFVGETVTFLAES